MRRAVGVVLVAVVVLGVSGVVAADSFATVLYTDSLTEDFKISGWVVGRLDADTVVVDIEYELDLTNDAYNKSEVTGFRLLLVNSSSVVASTDIDTFDIKDNQTVSNDVRITTQASPDSITRVRFRLNHTATLANGQTTDRAVSGSFPLEIRTSNQSLEYVEIQPNVTRGSNATVSVSTSRIVQMHMDGTPMQRGDAGMFYGNISIPDTSELGNRTFVLNLTTGRGEAFLQRVTTAVLNRPPTVNIVHPENTMAGNNLPVQVNVEDDTGVENIMVTFQNQTLADASGEFVLPTADLSPGGYQFTATAVDEEGASTTMEGLFVVTAEAPQDTAEPGVGGDGNGDTGENGEGPANGESQYSENASVLISVVNAIREFFAGLLGG